VVDHSHGDPVSVGMEFCCPPARNLLSAYKEYPLSVVTDPYTKLLGSAMWICYYMYAIIHIYSRCHRDFNQRAVTSLGGFVVTAPRGGPLGGARDPGRGRYWDRTSDLCRVKAASPEAPQALLFPRIGLKPLVWGKRGSRQIALSRVVLWCLAE
jgi:hypothetical protein